MEANTFTNFQTCFRINAGKSGEPVFERTIAIVHKWLLHRERDRILRAEAEKFGTNARWTGLFRSAAAVETNSFRDERTQAWALRYTHPDSEYGRRRFWYTEIGVKGFDGQVIFYARISYAWHRDTLEENVDAPKPNVPAFVRDFIKAGLRLYSEYPAFGLFNRPIPLNIRIRPDLARSIASLVLSPKRRYPMLIVNGGGAHAIAQAKWFAHNLTGKCQVLQIEDDPDFIRDIGRYLPIEYRIPHGCVRVFFAMRRKRDTPARHRWYDLSADDYLDRRISVCNALLRNHPLEEEGAIRGISDVSRLSTVQNLSKHREQTPTLQAEVAAVMELVDELERERNEAKQMVDYLTTEVDELESSLREEKAANESMAGYRKTLEESSMRVRVLDEEFHTLPSSLSDVLRIQAALHSQRLELSAEAQKTAEEYGEFQHLREAWQMLHHLARDLWDLTWGDERGCDLERRFLERSGYQLAMSEGRQTKRDASLMSLRQITHGGQAFDITPHIKWGNRPPKILRIHFAFDNQRRRFVLGWLGDHLDNATTKKIT